MARNKDLIKLKHSLWGIAFLWVVYDFAWVYSSETADGQDIGNQFIYIMLIPPVWWGMKLFVLANFSMVKFLDNSFLELVYRFLMIGVGGFLLVIALVFKVAQFYSGAESEVGQEPVPVLMLIAGAALFYFAMLGRFSKPK